MNRTALVAVVLALSLTACGEKPATEVHISPAVNTVVEVPAPAAANAASAPAEAAPAAAADAK